MILVDSLRPCRAPWPGGVACHMISDCDRTELLSFAASLGIPWAWCQEGPQPHFDLSPRLRARAIAAGARAMDRREFVDRKSTRLNSSHIQKSRMPSSA